MFANVHSAYAFEDHGNGDWMARHFFTGGIMPSEDLLHGFEKELVINRQWRLNGIHYARTCEAWLANMDRHKSEILSLFGGTYGAKEARRRWVYWRVFFRSCAELFAYARGEEWVVAHYVLEKS
jgi:cyclopropane-fatty-acyl-phospholipid synthase